MAAWAINDSGLMVGQLSDDGVNDFAASFSPSGSPTTLPGPGDQGANLGTDTFAQVISDNGLIAGEEATSSSAPVPAFWQASSFSLLNIPNSDANGFAVTAINNNGQIVGYQGPGQGFSSSTGAYWQSPTSNLQGFSPSGFIPLSMNNSGLVVGAVYGSSSIEFFKVNVTSTTTATDLRLSAPATAALTLQEPSTRGIVVNDAGTIALASGSGLSLVEISASGAQTTLATGAIPEAINEQGDIVGQTTGGRAFVYTPSKGLLDLNSYVNPSAKVTLVDAFGIEGSGQVLASDGFGGFYLLQLPSGAF